MTRQPRRLKSPQLSRSMGFPGLFGIIYTSVGFSIYFALGVVAGRGLGLTPLIFLGIGLLFIITALTYIEGGTMFRERGGSSTFARHAFNELIAFIAGWAILIDYLIVIALAALAIPHYLAPLWGELNSSVWEVGVGAAVIIGISAINILDINGRGRTGSRALVALALADVLLQVTVIIVGVLVVWHPESLTQPINVLGGPGFKDVIYAAVLSMLAYAGIEAASNLAPDIDDTPEDLRKIMIIAALTIPLIYAAISAVALMALPVHRGPDGPVTALGTTYAEVPVLGVVSAFQPTWVADVMRWVVALVAAPVLFWAASTSMLGVSRHVYTLAVNRQIPSWLGKLGRTHQTPYVAIVLCAMIAFGLLIPASVVLLAGIYAFGATLAITIAHFSILRLRWTQPDQDRPFRVPFDIRFRGVGLPIPALFGGMVSALAFVSVLIYHDRARWVGGGWMFFGLVGYVVYRRFVEGVSLTDRVSVAPTALTKQVHAVQYHTILVPVFGTPLDDDIVGTAGRLAAEAARSSDENSRSRLDLVYVVEVPVRMPLECTLSEETQKKANDAIERAIEVGSEYTSVDVTAQVVRARSAGPGIVEAAREAGAETIVIGGEPPTRVGGGATFGGVRGQRPAEIGSVTEYVLEKAACRVLLTAPPTASEEPDGGPERDAIAELPVDTR